MISIGIGGGGEGIIGMIFLVGLAPPPPPLFNFPPTLIISLIFTVEILFPKRSLGT